MTLDELRREQEHAVVLANSQGQIIAVNTPFSKLFGWAEAEIVGKPLTVIIPRNLHDAHHLGFSRFVTTGRPTLLNQALDLKAVTREGREFDAEHFIVAEKDGDQWVFGARIRPKG